MSQFLSVVSVSFIRTPGFAAVNFINSKSALGPVNTPAKVANEDVSVKKGFVLNPKVNLEPPAKLVPFTKKSCPYVAKTNAALASAEEL